MNGDGSTHDGGARRGGEYLEIIVTGDIRTSEDGDPTVSLVQRGRGERDVGEVETKGLNQRPVRGTFDLLQEDMVVASSKALDNFASLGLTMSRGSRLTYTQRAYVEGDTGGGREGGETAIIIITAATIATATITTVTVAATNTVTTAATTATTAISATSATSTTSTVSTATITAAIVATATMATITDTAATATAATAATSIAITTGATPSTTSVSGTGGGV